MAKKKQDFIIDRLTDSILNVVTGDSFPTTVARTGMNDIKVTSKSNGWKFDRRKEFENISKEIYKLTITGNPAIVQGMLSLTIKSDYIFMNLLENAPFNLGKGKIYEGVAGNLVAYAYLISFQRGFDGFIAFDAKTALIEHYQKTLGAVHFRGTRMVISEEAATVLVKKYFKNY